MITDAQRARMEKSRRRAVSIRASKARLVGRDYYVPQLHLSTRDTIKIVRRPDNPHDPNAHEVHVSLNGTWVHVGHIDRNTAKLLSTVDVKAAKIKESSPWELPVSVDIE
jgi:hypothetical protein